MIWSGQNNNRCFAISTQSNEVVIGQGFLWESCKKWFDFNGGRSSFITWKNWKDKKWNKKYIKSKGKTKGDKSFVITQSQISLILKLIFLRGRFSCQLYVLYELLLILTTWKSVKRCKIINYNQFWMSIKIPLEMKSQWNHTDKQSTI